MPFDNTNAQFLLEDLPDLPDDIRQGLEPLVRHLNSANNAVAGALAKNVSLSDNIDNEVQTVNLTHGVPQTVSLKRLDSAKGVRLVGAGSADGKSQYMVDNLHLIGSSEPNQVRLVAYFSDDSAKQVPVTVELTPEGSASSIVPAAPKVATGATGAAGAAGATGATGAGFVAGAYVTHGGTPTINSSFGPVVSVSFSGGVYTVTVTGITSSAIIVGSCNQYSSPGAVFTSLPGSGTFTVKCINGANAVDSNIDFSFVVAKL